MLRFTRAHPRYASLVARSVGFVERTDRPDDELPRQLARFPVFAVRATCVGAPREVQSPA